jgi:hybrid cluster-associated redox disulfide protein
MPSAKPSPAISRTMPVAEIVTFCPQAKGLLAEYGLHCFQCAGSEYETLEEGCKTHGFDDEEIDGLVDDLNEALAEMPSRPATLIVTQAAALAIRQVAEEEKRLGEGLAVIVDGHGGFCMEFRKDPEGDERTFVQPAVPDVRVFASALTLQRIGGSTVDFREGRFKLDLPEDAAVGDRCACGSGGCGCKGKGQG